MAINEGSLSHVRVRFAPSPTGYLHVGGARTALFNWLFARKHSGTFILRIEDTDLERSSPEVIEAIIEGLTWLGLDWDEGPYLQSNDVGSHKKAALRLLESGHAYPCFCTQDVLKLRRDAAAQLDRQWRYDRTCLDLPDAERRKFLESGTPHVLRFRVPDGETTFNDFVHGPTVFRNEEIEDFVLLRSDGTPTYHLSVVTDDIAMEITHIIRGDDHLSNTPKQILLYRAFGMEPPTFAHLPLILGEDKKRLSKRHGAVSVLEYRDIGIVPDAMFNFLALLGWSPGGDLEVLSREDLVRLFSFEGIGKAGAVFDLQKLNWLSGQYIAKASAEELAPRLRTFFEKAGLWDPAFEGERKGWFAALVELLRPRCRTYVDFVDAMRPFLSDDFTYEEEAARKHFKDPEVRARLRSLRGALAGVPDWADTAIEAATRSLAESLGLSAGKLIHPTRVALTGRGVSPGLFEVMVALGRDRTLARLDRAIAHVGHTAVH
jgi:glutamyl-tRNA synthetase